MKTLQRITFNSCQQPRTSPISHIARMRLGNTAIVHELNLKYIYCGMQHHCVQRTANLSILSLYICKGIIIHLVERTPTLPVIRSITLSNKSLSRTVLYYNMENLTQR